MNALASLFIWNFLLNQRKFSASHFFPSAQKVLCFETYNLLIPWVIIICHWIITTAVSCSQEDDAAGFCVLEARDLKVLNVCILKILYNIISHPIEAWAGLKQTSLTIKLPMNKNDHRPAAECSRISIYLSIMDTMLVLHTFINFCGRYYLFNLL